MEVWPTLSGIARRGMANDATSVHVILRCCQNQPVLFLNIRLGGQTRICARLISFGQIATYGIYYLQNGRLRGLT